MNDQVGMSAFQVVDAIQEKITPEMESRIIQSLDDKEWSKIGPLPTAIDAMIAFPELLAQLPPVRSAPRAKDKHRGPYVEGNQPADYYPVEKQGKKKKRIVWRSHSQDLAERSPYGKLIAEEWEAIKAADPGNKKREGKYAETPREELLAMETHWKPRVSGNIKQWQDAIGIVQQLSLLAQCKNLQVMVHTTPVKQVRSLVMPNIEGAPWRQGTAEKPEYLYPTTQPFYIVKCSIVNGRELWTEHRSVSINDLLGWDIAAAGGENATVESLDKTLERGAGDAPDMAPAINGPDKLQEYLSETVAYLERPERRADAIGTMRKKSGKDLLTAMRRLHVRLNVIFGADKVLREAADAAIKEEDTAQEEAEETAAAVNE